MKPIVAFAAAATLALAATTASAQDTQAPATTAAPEANVVTPESFVMMAASSSAFEIASSQLALENSQNQAVQAFARQMIADHTAATEDLTAAAEAEGLTVPAGLDPRHQAMLEELQQAGGDAFDSAYVTMQRQAHIEAVTLHQAVAEAGEAGGALSAHAAEVLPVLQEHLQMVEELGAR